MHQVPQHEQPSQLKATDESASKGHTLSPPAFQLKAGAADAGAPPAAKQGPGGLPGDLVNGFAASTGHDLSNVNVHYNSAAPSKVGALAFAQGNDIHLGAGQEQHLAHEAAHVVQQREGRVQANTEVNGMAVNDSPSLEGEADTMGAKAMQMKAAPSGAALPAKMAGGAGVGQMKVMQRRAILPEETNALGHLGKLATETQREWDAKENLASLYDGMAKDMSGLKTNLESQIKDVPVKAIDYKGTKYEQHNDPQGLRVAMWAITQWYGNATLYAKSKELKGPGVTTAGAGDYKCNRFTGDGFAMGAGMGYGINGANGSYPVGERTGLSGFMKGPIGYPPSANELGNKDKDIAHTKVIDESEAKMGDIIAFPYGEGIGHTGLVLTDKLYVSARHDERRPGVKMQTDDGVQITRIPGNDKVFRHVDGGTPGVWDTNFNFKFRIPKGGTVMNLMQGGDLRVSGTAHYDKPSGLGEGQDYYDVLLMKQDGTPVDNGARYWVDQDRQYVWKNLEAGQYYFKMEKPNTEQPLGGKLHAEIVNEKK